MKYAYRLARKYGARVAVVGGTAVGTSAFAVDPATAVEAVTSLSTSSAGFGPVMFGLSVAVVGIMIGVKWIKRARGAAYCLAAL